MRWGTCDVGVETRIRFAIGVSLAGLVLASACGDSGSDENAATKDAGDERGSRELPSNTAGKPCEEDSDCGGGSCVTELAGPTAIFGGAPVSAPGGYCTTRCSASEQCGDGGICVGAELGVLTGATGENASGTCYSSCAADEDCREGYRCISALLGVPIATTGGGAGSCQPAPETDQLQDGVVGTACSEADECAGGRCMSMGGFPANTPYPQGYCSGRCLSDSDCGADGQCAQSIDGSAGTCYLKCSEDDDCGRDGYRCRAALGIGLGLGANADAGAEPSASKQCVPGNPPLPDGVVGRACASDADCGSVAMSCRTQLTSQFSGQRTPLPGGYCSSGCVDASDCGAGGVCSGALAGVVSGTCFKGCTADEDCREGYVCAASSNLAGGNGQRMCTVPPPQPPDDAEDAGVP